MPQQLPKAYDPAQIEARWAEHWVREKLFHVDTPAPGAVLPPVFTLCLPPPNVTGRLHMGHMLNHTQMDIIVRWHRMRGHLSLWLPGTDHAGIATQMMVERRLAAEGKNRRGLGRGAFLERVWKWREEYGGAILAQMKRLGESVDWDREYFTMDERMSQAVREAFVRLHEQGLIYRGNYIVNWCPRCGTAISDLEVVHEETTGKLYEIKYPVTGTSEFLSVATTRPETMLGDTAVAVHPRDARYAHLHGKTVLLPLTQREIPIILDELAQPEFGTGAVKVTPAHDPNDFQAGLRHNLPQMSVMDESARMNENAGRYAGLDRHEARQQILQDLEAQGLLAGAKDYIVPLGKCDRCGTIVEPRLSRQWFVAVSKKTVDGKPSLAEKAIAVVQSGQVRFVPENYKQIYLNWMENIHDWCISRQLWWGHRIPAWTCAGCDQILVAREVPSRCPHCGHARLEQDPDVLDTWFSSGLLPMSALGWPESTRDLEVFYPTSLLITAYEILFFWVARMIMFGCHFLNDVPFRDVYIHALVRDAERQKMSKTKGNVIDPVQIIEQYGTDATRFTLAAMASPGTDIAFNPKRTEGYRAFANKIWNAARFILMNKEEELQESYEATGLMPLEDRWMLGRLRRVTGEINASLAIYRFDEAAQAIYTFFWSEFCDWYIELVKPRLLSSGSEESRREKAVAFSRVMLVFEHSLRLLAPFMPFLTEELWHALFEGKPPLKSIAFAAYPDNRELPEWTRAEFGEEMGNVLQMAILQDLIISVRNLRAELKIEPKQRVRIQIHTADDIRAVLEENQAAIERLAGVEQIEFIPQSLARETGVRSTSRFEVRVLHQQQLDVAAERERLQKELARLDKEAAGAESQLANGQFLARAPADVVAGRRQRLHELHALREKLQSALAALPPA